MADIVNLHRKRKQKKRAERRMLANENAKRFGLSLQEKMAMKSEQKARLERLEGHRLDDDACATQEQSDE